MSKTFIFKGSDTDLVVGDFEEISGNGTSNPYKYLPIAESIKGTTPLIITTLPLTAGTYATAATIGTDSATRTATLEFRKTDNTLIDTISHTGTAVVESSGAGFTLAADALVIVALKGGDSATTSFILSLSVI